MNLIEALESRGIPFKPHSTRENEIYLCCPFCAERGETPDHRFRFGVNYVTGQAHCFNCGKKFRDVDFLKKALQEKLNAGDWQLAMNAIKRQAKEPSPVHMPEDFIALSKVHGRLSHWDRIAMDYLHRRGVTASQIAEKNIGYSMVGDFRYRIIIPVYFQGKLEGLVGRAFVSNLEPKYRNSLGNKTLFNVPKKRRSVAILSEGAFDALAIERGMPMNMDSLGILGSSLTERQLAILKDYDRFILWMDPDQGGVDGTIRIGRQLKIMKKPVDVVVPKLLGGVEYDPSDHTPSEVYQRIKQVEHYSEALEQTLKLRLAFKED